MMTVLDYFERVQVLAFGLSGVGIERYEEQVFSRERGNLRLRLRFLDNSMLEISEAIQIVGGSLAWLSYRYHYQNPDGSVIFRYDNAPHHAEISTHPEHKHVKESVLGAVRPDIEWIFVEVSGHLQRL